MDEKTVKKILELNRKFYRENSEGFSNTRKSYWDGFDMAIPYLKEGMSILDLGCGNGRFARFASEHIGKYSYMGIDSSKNLLSIAKSLKIKNAEFKREDVLRFDLQRKFDLVACFGVIHHIPSYNNRLNLLTNIRSHLDTSGIAIITIWQFAKFKRFKNKYIDPTSLDLDLNLENDDYLLSWGKDQDFVRYAHYLPLSEQNSLLAKSGLKLISQEERDGKTGTLNRYLILQKK